METKEKLIIVHYLNVDNMTRSQAEDSTSLYMESIEEQDSMGEHENVIHYFMPVRKYPSRVDCINPKLISNEEYDKVKDVLDRFNQAIEELYKEK